MSDLSHDDNDMVDFEEERLRIDTLLDEEKLYLAFDDVANLQKRASDEHELIRAFMTKAKFFDLIGSKNLELALYDDAQTRFSETEDEDILWHLSWMMFNEGVITGEAGDFEKAIESYERAIDFANRSGDDAKDAALKSLYNLASTSLRAGNKEKSFETYRQIINEYEHSDDLSDQEQVARVHASLGNALMAEEDYEGAKSEFMALFAMPQEPLALMPRLLRERSRVMLEVAKLEEAFCDSGLDALGAIVAELGRADSADIREVAAFALFNKARFELDVGYLNRARDDYALLLEMFGTEEDRVVHLLDGARAGLREAKVLISMKEDSSPVAGSSPGTVVSAERS